MVCGAWWLLVRPFRLDGIQLGMNPSLKTQPKKTFEKTSYRRVDQWIPEKVPRSCLIWADFATFLEVIFGFLVKGFVAAHWRTVPTGGGGVSPLTQRSS